MPENSLSNNRRIAKNTLLLYFRSILLLLINLYSSRVILQALGVSDYGIYNVVGGVVTMFTMLSGSMSSASQRFITYALGEGDLDKLRIVFATSVTLHVIIGAIVVLFVELFGVWFLYEKLNIPSNRLSIAFWVLQFSIATLFINIISVPYNSAIIAHEKMSAFAYISILEAILKLVIAYCLLWSSFDKLFLYAILMFFAALLIRIIYIIYSNKKFNESQKVKLMIEPNLFKDMFSFAGWNLLGNGSLLLRNQGVDILLNLFFGVAINAAKGICNQVQSAVYQFVTNFQTAVTPQLTMAVAQHDYERAHLLINQGGRFSFYMLSLFVVPLVVATPEVLSLWLVEVPDYTIVFIRWTAIYLLLDCLSSFLVVAVLAYGKIKTYQIVVGGTKILTLPLVYVWLLLGGSPVTGILTNIIIEVICLGQRLYFNSKYNGLLWETYLFKTVLPCWGIFAISLIPSFLIRLFVSTNIVVLVITSLLFVSSTICLFGLNRSERRMIINKASSYILNIDR